MVNCMSQNKLSPFPIIPRDPRPFLYWINCIIIYLFQEATFLQLIVESRSFYLPNTPAFFFFFLKKLSGLLTYFLKFASSSISATNSALDRISVSLICTARPAPVLSPSSAFFLNSIWLRILKQKPGHVTWLHGPFQTSPRPSVFFLIK